MQPIFAYTSRIGTLSEHYENGEFYFLLSEGERTHRLSLYEVSQSGEERPAPYLGYTKEEILAAGRDLLGERLMREGDPDYRKVRTALPPLVTGTYTLLGGAASVAGLTVDAGGTVFHQLSGRQRTLSPIFTPAEYDTALGALPPHQHLVGGYLPLLLSVHSDGVRTLELLYFVEPTDPDRDPICWIRAKRYENAAPERAAIEYRVAAIAREEEESVLFDSPPAEGLFLDALHDTVAHWVDFSESGARFTLPEAELANVANGTPMMAAITYTGDHAHYGHRFYGKELHDNFPPNYISMIEAMIRLGRHAQARDVFSHFLHYSLRLDGRINYRQGTSLLFASSAAEYGMLLSLAATYREALEVDRLGIREWKKLIGMGEEITSHLSPCPELSGLPLVRMCAEADTNERIHAYLNNNLWAIRGLSALASLLGEERGARYREVASTLWQNVCTALDRFAVKGTRFGTLPPFRIGYTATPMTLSRCEETFYPLKGEERTRYFGVLWERYDLDCQEDLVENAFANYRYYPEMLSSLLLPKEYTDAIVAMREAIGGEVLGMTRFLARIDDWPVMHYARFLLESGRIEKYLLLLFAHTAHHGSPKLLTYYEQVSLDGAVVAYDCLPSLLTVPLMLAWAFAYEGENGTVLRLLSALPKAWYCQPFRARGVGYSGGVLDICSDGRRISVAFDRPPSLPVELVLRHRDILTENDIAEGAEYVASIRGNRLLLKEGIQNATIVLR